MEHTSIDDVFMEFRGVSRPSSVRGGYHLSAEAIHALLESDQRALPVIPIVNYLAEVMYTAGEVDDFVYLLPGMLTTWARYHASVPALREVLPTALSRKNVIYYALTPRQRDVVLRYIREVIAGHMASALSPMGSHALSEVLLLIELFNSYGVYAEDVGVLWNDWWNCRASGAAVCAAVFASYLAFDDGDNPVVQRWFPDVPSVSSAVMLEITTYDPQPRWLEDGISFLRHTLTADYLQERILTYVRPALSPHSHNIMDIVSSSLLSNRWRVESRIDDVLTSRNRRVRFWTI